VSDLYVVILNPAADRGRAGRKEGRIRRALKHQGIPFEFLRTQGPGHAAELAQKALGEKPTAVVGAGGDGTLNEIAQALVGTEVPLGIIPCGSGNDLIRALGIPRDIGGAVRILSQGRPRAVDVGRAAGRFFLNTLGMGFDGQVASDYRRMRLLKGELGYLWAVLIELFRFRGFGARVVAGERTFEGDLILIPVQNGPYAGGGFLLAPGARIDDGLLDLVLVANRRIPARLQVLVGTRSGRYLSLPRIWRQGVRRIEIETERPLPVHLDGEILSRPLSSLEVELLPQSLRVIAP